MRTPGRPPGNRGSARSLFTSDSTPGRPEATKAWPRCGRAEMPASWTGTSPPRTVQSWTSGRLPGSGARTSHVRGGPRHLDHCRAPLPGSPCHCDLGQLQLTHEQKDARLRPVEGAWSVMEKNLGNVALGTTGQPAIAMRHQLKRI
jgi:hypothetical protein